MTNGRVNELMNALINSDYSIALDAPQSRVEYLLMSILASGGGGGSGGGLAFYLCSSNEYNAITGEPIIENPSENTIYFVPNGSSGTDRYVEWGYIHSAWERLGSVGNVLTNLTSLLDVDISDPEGNQVLAYDSESTKWENKTLRDFCFVTGDANQPYVVGGASASDLG